MNPTRIAAALGSVLETLLAAAETIERLVPNIVNECAASQLGRVSFDVAFLDAGVRMLAYLSVSIHTHTNSMNASPNRSRGRYLLRKSKS